MKSIFGWSYPAGCSGPPDNDELPCDMCGHEVGVCICPECPDCGSAGDPYCYEYHNLSRNPEQIEGRKALEKQWEEDNKANAEADLNYAKQCEADLKWLNSD